MELFSLWAICKSGRAILLLVLLPPLLSSCLKCIFVERCTPYNDTFAALPTDDSTAGAFTTFVDCVRGGDGEFAIFE